MNFDDLEIYRIRKYKDSTPEYISESKKGGVFIELLVGKGYGRSNYLMTNSNMRDLLRDRMGIKVNVYQIQQMQFKGLPTIAKKLIKESIDEQII